MLANTALVTGQQAPGGHLFLPPEGCNYRYMHTHLPYMDTGFKLSLKHAWEALLSYLTSPSSLISLTTKKSFETILI